VRREPFWPAQLSVAAAIALDLTLPHRLAMGPVRALPGLEAILLLPLAVVAPHRVATRDDLLVSAITIWLANVLVFALW
jgi:hypothetical protein